MDEQDCEKHHFQIMRATLEGDTETLQELIDVGILRKGNISHPWEILYAAIMSRSLEALKLVLTCYEPEPPPGRPYAPAIYACGEQSPPEIIICLMEHFTQPDAMTPLTYVCVNNDVELAKALIAYEANRNPSCSMVLLAPLFHVATLTANLELLQLLVDAYKTAGGTYLTYLPNSRETGLEMIVQNASFEVEKKIDCFKILFNGLYPDAMKTYPERYNVNDIARLAVFSTESTSLIPYFIETELMWETRKSISSLYKRLLPEYEMLALFVLCECGPTTVEREEFDMILGNFLFTLRKPLIKELVKLYANAIKLVDQGEVSNMEALVLLEEMASFIETSKIDFFKSVLQDILPCVFCKTPINRTHLYQPSYHRAAEALSSIAHFCSVRIIEELIWRKDVQPMVMFSVLKLYPCQMMRPDYNETTDSEVDISKCRLFTWFVHLFSPWEMIRRHVGKPMLELFTLKRFASDVVREAVFKGVHNDKGAEHLFLDRIQSLDLPKDLIDYLSYCDHGSINYFLEHLDADKRLIEAVEDEDVM